MDLPKVLSRPFGSDTSPSEGAEVSAEELPKFFIDLRPRLLSLPDIRSKSSINIRYPLLPPYAFAHIYWNEEMKELIYDVEEQQLNDTEKELLKLIQLGLEEMINISFAYASKSNLLLKYLEKNVQLILLELGAKVSRKSYLNIMYYLYRDFIGLNEIEALMNDQYIEDIECNGVSSPIYVVHRKYQNMRTNVIFREPKRLVDFIEKLAQKTGRYVSFAKPLLDGTLPDGSRVNATYTSDVTTHGPTFTIRKFTKEPLTPVHLIGYGTSTAEVFAYLWLAVENKFNIMVIGETASGKTTLLNSILQFVPTEARIVSIEDTRELSLAHENWVPSVSRTGFGIPNLLGKQYGEVTLFDLLKETFRQNPDYVVVGEVRGKEAYVLFQGMASGHPSFSTFHAASVETVIRRLETPPISLPASLIDSLDVAVSIIHIKDQRRNIRRVKDMREIIEVKQELGKADTNLLFEWNPVEDEIVYHGNSYLLEEISKKTGIPLRELERELRIRSAVLNAMKERNIMNYEEVSQIVNQYYKDPASVIKLFGLAEEATLRAEDVKERLGRDAAVQSEGSTPEVAQEVSQESPVDVDKGQLPSGHEAAHSSSEVEMAEAEPVHVPVAPVLSGGGVQPGKASGKRGGKQSGVRKLKRVVKRVRS
ncbi:type II/IV secretion system ATPase subunit [Candidatus Woesearchaeota archaeon]|nr:type II/IV secretion system ATPase subunit [Candidatus Woesearchaeota archaeon]